MEHNPHQLADSLLDLSEQFSRYSGEFAALIKKQADFCNASRMSYKSDTATQRAFDATEDGVKMAVIRMKLKALTTQMSAIKSYLKNAQEEAHGTY